MRATKGGTRRVVPAAMVTRVVRPCAPLLLLLTAACADGRGRRQRLLDDRDARADQGRRSGRRQAQPVVPRTPGGLRTPATGCSRRAPATRSGLDQQFLLQLTLVNGRTGDVAVSTPRPRPDREDAALHRRGPVPGAAEGAHRAPTGCPGLVAASADDAYGDAGAPQYGIKPGDPLVMVADVVAVPPDHGARRARGADRQAARRPADRRRARRGGASAGVRAAPDPEAEEAGRGAARASARVRRRARTA